VISTTWSACGSGIFCKPSRMSDHVRNRPIPKSWRRHSSAIFAARRSVSLRGGLACFFLKNFIPHLYRGLEAWVEKAAEESDEKYVLQSKVGPRVTVGMLYCGPFFSAPFQY
jgi:hypothetical protein